MVAFAAEQDRRIRLLLGFGIEPDRVEGDKFVVEFRLILGPQGLHGQHAFAQYLEAAPVVRAMICHLLGIPAPPMPKTKRPPESRSRLATDLAVTIGSRCGTSAIPVPRQRVRVAAAANASPTKGSCVCE